MEVKQSDPSQREKPPIAKTEREIRLEMLLAKAVGYMLIMVNAVSKMEKHIGANIAGESFEIMRKHGEECVKVLEEK